MNNCYLNYARSDDEEIVISESDVTHPRCRDYAQYNSIDKYTLIEDLANVPSFHALFADIYNSTVTVELYVEHHDDYTEYFEFIMNIDLNQAFMTIIFTHNSQDSEFTIPVPHPTSPDIFKSIAKALRIQDGKPV